MSGLSPIGNQGLKTGGSPRRFGSDAAVRWLLPVLSVAGAVILSRVLEFYWQSTPFTSLFICAVMISAWFGGFGPGLLAVTLSLLAFDYYFLPPFYSFAVEWNAMPRLILFAAAALMVALLAASQKSRTESLGRARDDLAAKVQELNRTNEALHAENTERKLAKEKLQRSEAYLSEGQRLSHTGSWAWNVKMKENVFWSKEHFRIYGFDPETSSGDYQAARDRIHPDDALRFDEAVERAIRERKDFETNHRVILPSGAVRHIHTTGHPVFNDAGELIEFIGTTMDVTERKQSDALLSSEKHILEMIAGGAPLQAVLNELCSAIDEQSPGSISTVLSLDLERQKLWPVAGSGVPEGWARSISPLAIGPVAGSCGTAAYRKEAVVVSDIATDPLWADFRDVALSFGLKACWSKPIISTTGSVLGTFAMYYRKVHRPDKSDLLLIERATHMAQIAIERDRTHDSLREAQANLAHATRVATMGELTASIAHEVNQPLTAVVNNANASISLLPKGVSNLEEVREALAEIIDDANRASDVIARVRQLAKRAPIEKSFLDLRDVVQDVLALARYELAARRITIRTDLSKDLPSVSGDRVQLQQVLLNLIINGMDAMNKVEESKRVLTLCGRRETRDGTFEALLSVSDSGIGFKPEEMDRLFEAFYTTKPQGMGMGLAISRSIIEAHGGRLWAEPNQGSGVTFLFSLPAATNAES